MELVGAAVHTGSPVQHSGGPRGGMGVVSSGAQEGGGVCICTADPQFPHSIVKQLSSN